MRTGVNPEKFKSERNIRHQHRVIIPVHIPISNNEYYRSSLEVLKHSLQSLLKTVNFETTAISIINNASNPEVEKLITDLYNKGQISKYVIYNENRGKVHAVISEAKASFEDFITIADCDVLFFEGWEKAVFEIFKAYPKSGVVSPLPSQNLALYYNSSLFFDLFLKGKIKYKKLVSDGDCELFLKGLGNPSLLDRHNAKYSWKEKQYYLDNSIKAILGANHFVATYRREVLISNDLFPSEKFKKGFEENYMDAPADKLGWYRLSTPKTYAYHIGNELDFVTSNTVCSSKEMMSPEIFKSIKAVKKSKIPYLIKRMFFKILRSVKQL